MSTVGTPRPGHFWLFLAVGVACLLLLDLEFAPDWLAETPAGAGDGGAVVVPEPPPTTNEGPKRPSMPAAARVPTIVARFGTESKEPLDDSGIKALASAMIEDHEARVVLEGHSDTLGAEDFNHDLSLERANLVKARLVSLGVSEERIETVGLGATRPLHSDSPDAASVNRRVEVRWIGKDGSGRPAPVERRPVLAPSGPVVAPPIEAARDAATEPRPDAASVGLPTVGTTVADAGAAGAIDAESPVPATDPDSGS